MVNDFTSEIIVLNDVVLVCFLLEVAEYNSNKNQSNKFADNQVLDSLRKLIKKNDVKPST